MDGRFLCSFDGIYSTHLTYSRFWSRYTEIFDRVVVVARVSSIKKVPKGLERADGANVEFYELPDFQGIWGLFNRKRNIMKKIEEAIKDCDIAILRVPGVVSTLVWIKLNMMGRRYACEVVGDPFRSIIYSRMFLPIRIPLSAIAWLILRIQCKKAFAVAYVTKRVLQRSYPSKGFIEAFSDVDIKKNNFIDYENIKKKREEWEKVLKLKMRPWRVIFIGSLDQPYKGLEIALKALSISLKRGVDWEFRVVGDGRLRKDYENLTVKLGINNKVKFIGKIPAGRAIIEQLNWSDLFILPSFTEGMPRALIEAMARGLPCIATSVGGIPELLPNMALVPKGQIGILADKICDLLRQPELMEYLALMNVKKAEEIESSIISINRRQFYTKIKELVTKDT